MATAQQQFREMLDSDLTSSKTLGYVSDNGFNADGSFKTGVIEERIQSTSKNHA